MKRIETVTITQIREETPDTRTIFFNKNLAVQPGQFLMVWTGNDEIPLSPSFENAITVKNVGPGSAELFKKETGDPIGIRGPYGTHFQATGKILAVGGGTGIAPLALLKRQNPETTLLFGAKTKSQIYFRDLSPRACTEDGSKGFKGFPTELMEQLLSDNKYDLIATCGPEVMMAKVLEIAKAHNIPAQASLERYMKCGGLGICGSCVLSNGLRVCKDGPVFNSETLKDTSFGNWKLDKAGEKCSI